jgi:flavin-dependent dehydrogenase
VGAGPAGSVVSLVCAKKGLDTILLEKNPKVGSTNTKLDAAADEELSGIINKMKLKTENKVYKSKWYPPSGNYFLLRSSSPEYFFKRGPDDDSIEVSTAIQAEEAGCKILLDAKIEHIKEVDTRVNSITAKKSGENLRIKPKILVAADGGNSLFHRFVYKRSENRKKVGYGLNGKNFSDIESSNIYFDSENIPGGYFYLITGKSETSTGCIVLDSSNMKKSVKEYFNNFISVNKELSEKIKSFSNNFGGEGLIFDIDKYVHENLVFVGDAAGLVDPFFGYGISSAIISGYYCGYSIAQAINEDFSMLKEYDSTIRAKFDKQLSYLYQRVFESLNNDDLDLIAEILNELDKKTDIDAILRQLSGKS